ncbi:MULTISPECIES: hypothetical protein [unclassified Helicobacter]|uniref:hypothetical protein n=1 Tax=unclassified Helicobacter TaxID=2593540 RepID=UPI000CF0A47D|nr:MULTISPECIES: hypothetical protein [unclassified Helicobacter]
MQKFLALILLFCFLLGYEKREIEQAEIPNVFSHSEELVLEAILNSRAKINGNWYQAGDKVLGFEIKEIRIKEVALKDLRKNIFLLRFGK